jgi:hypothetical protein
MKKLIQFFVTFFSNLSIFIIRFGAGAAFRCVELKSIVGINRVAIFFVFKL